MAADQTTDQLHARADAHTFLAPRLRTARQITTGAMGLWVTLVFRHAGWRPSGN
jgi:hypothetical protein